MGTPIPDDWPEIDPLLWHCCTLDIWASDVPGTGCDIGLKSTHSWCVFGQDIIDWINIDGQCSGIGLVHAPFLGNQRLIRVQQGHDTLPACLAAGCP